MKKLILMISLIALLGFGCQAQEKNNTSQAQETPASQDQEDNSQPEEKKRTTIEFVRNATMKIQYAGKTFLTDPMLGDQAVYPGFLNNEVLANPTAPMPVNIDDLLEDIEFTIVTHTHVSENPDMEGPSDHFDTKAVEVLNKEMPIYIQPYDQAGLERKGFSNLKTIETQTTIDNITVTRIPGIHADVEFLLPIVGDSSAYVFEAEGEPTIFWTGDTLLTDDMIEKLLSYKPDIVIVHSGGASLPIDAAGTMSQLVMNAEDTIELAKLLPEAKIMAIHMESLDHCPVTRQELSDKAKEAGVYEQFLIPQDGETIEF